MNRVLIMLSSKQFDNMAWYEREGDGFQHERQCRFRRWGRAPGFYSWCPRDTVVVARWPRASGRRGLTWPAAAFAGASRVSPPLCLPRAARPSLPLTSSAPAAATEREGEDGEGRWRERGEKKWQHLLRIHFKKPCVGHLDSSVSSWSFSLMWLL